MTSPTWTAKLIGQIVAGLALVGVVLYIGYAVFIAPDKAARDVAQSRQDTKAANAEVTVTKDAMNVMRERIVTNERTHEIMRENTHEIRSAPGASDQVPPPVHDAFVRSISRLREQAGEHHNEADQLP